MAPGHAPTPDGHDRALHLVRRGRWRAARNFLGSGPLDDPGTEALRLRIEAETKRLPVDEAQSRIRRIIESNPHLVEPRVHDAQLVATLGHPEAALAWLNDLLPRFGSEPQLRLALAALHAGNENFREAWTHYEAILRDGEIPSPSARYRAYLTARRLRDPNGVRRVLERVTWRERALILIADWIWFLIFAFSALAVFGLWLGSWPVIATASGVALIGAGALFSSCPVLRCALPFIAFSALPWIAWWLAGDAAWWSVALGLGVGGVIQLAKSLVKRRSSRPREVDRDRPPPRRGVVHG